MALIVELSPKLLLEYRDDFMIKRSVVLKSGHVLDYFMDHRLPIATYITLGGATGNLIKDIFIKNKLPFNPIEIRDESPIESVIYCGNNSYYGKAPDNKLTRQDIDNITRNFTSALYKEYAFLMPVFETEKDFVAQFLKKSKEYYRKSILFGKYALSFSDKKPDVIIATREEVEKDAPFKVMGDAELTMFSHSFVDESETLLIIVDESSLFFMEDKKCRIYDLPKTDYSMTLFATLFGVDSKLELDKLISLIIGANIKGKSTLVGDMIDVGERYKARTLQV